MKLQVISLNVCKNDLKSDELELVVKFGLNGEKLCRSSKK